MNKIRVLEVHGTPYDMGYQHGQAYPNEIRELAEERVRLSGDPKWSGQALPRARVLALAEACLEAHTAYSPELIEELQGISDATGVSLAELVILNGFTDFTDTLYNLDPGEVVGDIREAVAENCTAFIVPDSATPDRHGFYGQTWDMHASAAPYVILLHCRPKDAPAALLFTITGCVGMIGMNAAGLSVGINMLTGTDGQIGATWPFVIRKILAQTNIDAALECLTSVRLAGAHNYMIFDRTGRGYNVEAMATRRHITKLDGDILVHTNHCLFDTTRAVEQPRPPELQESSTARLSRAHTLLAKRPITPEALMSLTRDREAICRTATPPYHVETCGAAIMRPASGDFWAVWGLPTENEFERFVVKE